MKKILVVIDMQNDFITGTLGTKEAAQILPAVCEKIRQFDGTVFFTRDTHSEDYLSSQEGARLPVVHCINGTHGWELAPDIKALCEKKEAKVFDKETFGSVRLAQELCKTQKEEGIERIELIGVCTDICVISNALLVKAHLPEVPIWVHAGLCAGVTPGSHRGALEAMKMCQVEVIE